MKELTCVIVGAGYAGIHAAKAIHKAFKDGGADIRLRLVVLNKTAYHLRKVLLFKPAAGNAEICLPLAQLLPEGVHVVQGTVSKIEPDGKRLSYADAEGREQTMRYDRLVVAAGSVVREPGPELGGIALVSPESASLIRLTWQANLRVAAETTDAKERRRRMTVAVAGAGISGIETSAELICRMREEAGRLGLDPKDVAVHLVNANSRLFPEGPAKVGLKLESKLRALGVRVIHGCKAVREEAGTLTLSNGAALDVGLCIWTLGLMPNPTLRTLGLPVAADGRIVVDASYRVSGAPGTYAIGDGARIVDPDSGREDAATCKEATAQAARLGKIVLADATGRPAPTHKGVPDFFCFGLGPERGMAWTRKWGIDFIITGKLGWQVRKLTWDMASLLRG